MKRCICSGALPPAMADRGRGYSALVAVADVLVTWCIRGQLLAQPPNSLRADFHPMLSEN